jgi:LysR family transcriptional regulator, glycine cleavage system transcriptional activator
MNLPGTRLPPLNALRAFEAASRHLNFRVAADELGVTQGAVAQHVRGLEADLGIKLFERLSRSLALTDSGRRYAGQLRRAFEVMTDATAALRPEPARLTVSVTPTFAAKWLIPRLSAFTIDHSDIELRIVASEGLSNFHGDGVDIAVRQGRPPFGPGLIAELLFEQEVIAVGSPALVRDRAGALPPEEIGRFTLLNDGHDLWPEFIERALGMTPPPSSKQVSFNHTSLAIDTAAAGQGLTVASRFLVQEDLKSNRLVQAFAATMRGALDSYVVTLRKPRQPKPTESVRRCLLAHSGT